MGEAEISTLPFDSPEHYRRVRLKLIFYFERRGCWCAEDLAAECIKRIVAAFAANRSLGDLEAWAYGAAKNVHLEWLREVSKGAELSGAAKAPPQRQSWMQERARLGAELSVAKLEPDDRELLEEYFLDGASAETIARKSGLSAAGVRTRVFRLKKRLAEYVQEFMKSGRAGNVSADPDHIGLKEGGV